MCQVFFSVLFGVVWRCFVHPPGSIFKTGCNVVRMAQCTSKDWQIVEATEYFKRSEWGPRPDKVARELVFSVLELRRRLDLPCIIHESYAETGHSSQSRHYTDPARGRYQADAVDLHFRGGSLARQLEVIFDMEVFGGVGLYPFWQSRGRLAPGWHLDLRLRRHDPVLWWRRHSGEYVYTDQKKLFDVARASDLLVVWEAK